MSFKFSRRSTRVQRKPHVCVSEPQPWEPPPPTPTGLSAQWTWSLTVEETGDQSNATGMKALTETAPGVWTAVGSDAQAHLYELHWIVSPGNKPQCTIVIHGWGPQILPTTEAPNDYDGSGEWTSGPVTIEVESGVTGTGFWTLTFTPA